MEIRDYEISLDNLKKYDTILNQLSKNEPISINNYISTYDILFAIKDELFHMNTYYYLLLKTNASKYNDNQYVKVNNVVNKYKNVLIHINHLLTKNYKLNDILKVSKNKDLNDYIESLYRVKKVVHEDMNEIIEYNDNLSNKLLNHKYSDKELIDTAIEYVKNEEFLARQCNYKRYKNLVLYDNSINNNLVDDLINIWNKNKNCFIKVSNLLNKDYKKIVMDKQFSKFNIINVITNNYNSDMLNKTLYIFDNCIEYGKNNELVLWYNLMPKIFINYNNDIKSVSLLTDYISKGLYNYFSKQDIYNYSVIDNNACIMGYLNQLLVFSNLLNSDNKDVRYNANMGLLSVYYNFIRDISLLEYIDSIHNNINNINVNFIKKNKNYKKDILHVFNDYNEYVDAINICIANKLFKDNIRGNDLIKLMNKDNFGFDLTDNNLLNEIINDLVNDIINKK